MKINFDREAFLNAFGLVATVAPRKPPKPILGNVKLVTEEGEDRCHIAATDMELGISTTIEGVDVQRGGTVVLPVDRLGSILRESSDERLTIDCGDKNATIKGDRSRFKLNTMNPSDFPEMESLTLESHCSVSAALMRSLIKRTIFAIDDESSRFALSGVKIELTKGKVFAVGSDGRRLAKMQGKMKSVGKHETKEGADVIIPGKSIRVLARAIDRLDCEVLIRAETNWITFQAAGITLTSRLLEGRFPRWRDVIPKRDEDCAEIIAGTALTAVKQASIVSSKDTRGIDFELADNTLKVRGDSSEGGNAEIECLIAYSGEKKTVFLNSKYMQDFLQSLDLDESVSIEVAGEGSLNEATVMRSGDGYEYVVMPIAKQ